MAAHAEKIIVVLLRETLAQRTHCALHFSARLHTWSKCMSRTKLLAILMEKKSIPPKSLSLETYPFDCVQLPEKVVSGEAPVAFKSQHWAFPDKNVVHYLSVSF